MTGPEVTGGTGHWPVLDRHGRPLRVGDRLLAQVCVGPYGQTERIEATVQDAHWQYCQMVVNGRVIGTEFDRAAQVLRCARTWNDYEHGHQTWAEVTTP
jgi:hypothetical protein